MFPKHRTRLRTRARRLLDRLLRRPPAVTYGIGGPVIGRVVAQSWDAHGISATVELTGRRGARLARALAGPVPPVSFGFRQDLPPGFEFKEISPSELAEYLRPSPTPYTKWDLGDGPRSSGWQDPTDDGR